LKYRRPFIVAANLALVGASHYAAFWLRFDGDIPGHQRQLLMQVLPWLIPVRAVAFVPFGLYRGLWRYTGIWDLRNIVAGVAGSGALLYVLVRWVFGLMEYPRSVFIIDAILLTILLGGLRLAYRMYREFAHLGREKRVLIYGAGDAGEMIVRDMRNNRFYQFEPIGFLDDDRRKVGQRIHGVKVLGTRETLARILTEKKPDAVLVAMPAADSATIRSIVSALEPFKIPIQTLPNLRDVVEGKVTVTQIRTLSIEDLLERAPVRLDTAPLRHLIENRRVLVTGAGGSIGSELARQVAAYRPARLALLDRYENGLYTVTAQLAAAQPERAPAPIIADVTDATRINAVMLECRPDIVFHAAAHKHVPLMELNACEAVKNNVRGTRLVAEAARQVGVQRFVLISTDKAVNPTSVMGATKRVAEMLVQSMNAAASGTFASVRFGNVLGSNGSVVPLFLDQIKAGGPVTVTHAEMRRYFMLIPEAVHLVLRAAALATPGDIFVLEMGEQLRILDLARNLIRLSGFVPDEEIEIRLIGPRPGEKLYEELVGMDETAEPVTGERIVRVKPMLRPQPGLFAQQIAELEGLALQGDGTTAVKRLCELVPTYRPSVGGPLS